MLLEEQDSYDAVGLHEVLHFVSFHSDQPRPSADPDATLDEDEEPEHCAGLLSDRYFTVVGFDEHVERLWQIIESNGGNRAGKRQMADYAIFPMNTVPEGSLQAKQLVSYFTVHCKCQSKSSPGNCHCIVLSIKLYKCLFVDWFYSVYELCSPNALLSEGGA